VADGAMQGGQGRGQRPRQRRRVRRLRARRRTSTSPRTATAASSIAASRPRASRSIHSAPEFQVDRQRGAPGRQERARTASAAPTTRLDPAGARVGLQAGRPVEQRPPPRSRAGTSSIG
jgi:hypothetical protein